MEILPPLIAIFAPLLGSLVIALANSRREEQIATIGINALRISTVAALLSLYEVLHSDLILVTTPGILPLLAPTFLIDRLAAVMMILITAVSLVIHMYSRRYMQGDEAYQRFFALLSLLTSVLLLLVTSGHLLWLFAAWHTVTWILASLVAFNKHRAEARTAARVTVLIQSTGDLALILGIAFTYQTFETFNLMAMLQTLTLSPTIPQLEIAAVGSIKATDLIAGLFLLSVMTKSAQFPFHAWLAGTIEAPTPISAMLHAGIVNAGGFLVNRLAPLFSASPIILHLLFLIGALTAVIGASAMLTQPSIKRALVYSTMGQMGYMIMECGLGAFALAIFHLCAHGLFKATLFLHSSSSIHKARREFAIPPPLVSLQSPPFSFGPWITGLLSTLVLPLIIMIATFEVVHIPLFEIQGITIFLFFAWVTSSQATFTLYRMRTVTSWKLSATMIATLIFISVTYLWAGETFSHFLYPSPAQVASFFEAASWPQTVFGAFVSIAFLAIVTGWLILYGHVRECVFPLPSWINRLPTWLYVTFLNALYLEYIFEAAVSQRRKNSSQYMNT